jgi:hypothetical protein
MDYNVRLNLVQNTRSMQRFKLDPIPGEYIDKIVEVAPWAPLDYCGPEAFRTDEEINEYIRKSRTWTIASHKRKAVKQFNN